MDLGYQIVIHLWKYKTFSLLEVNNHHKFTSDLFALLENSQTDKFKAVKFLQLWNDSRDEIHVTRTPRFFS